MNNSSENKTSTQWLIFSSLLILSWMVLTHVGLVTAVKIWTISEIFNHCYIVLPASFYLIWEKRNEIAWDKIKPTLLPVPILIGQVLVYLFGLAGDINLLMHMATFTMLPIIIWILVGNLITKQIMFPLFFMIFAIPFGEELVPFLQELTADYSVLLLKISGIPLFRSGLYIEIPQGKFLVAEACSGVSFLIASIVLGNLYAYMNLRRKRTRIFFVVLSIIFPIFANVIRVYGIIMIGYSSDMKHAVGADHLIYGWFFFAFVLVCLFLIGELIRKREDKKLKSFSSKIQGEKKGSKVHIVKNILEVKYFLLIPLVIVLAGIAKAVALSTTNSVMDAKPFLIDSSSVISQSVKDTATLTLRKWEPRFTEATTILAGEYKVDETPFRLYSALYRPNTGELITSQNKIYSEDRWSRAGFSTEKIQNLYLNKLYLSSTGGTYMRVYFTYLVGDRSFTSRTHAKLYQTWLILLGNDFNTAFIALGFAGDGDRLLNPAELSIMSELYQNIREQMTEVGNDIE